MSGWNVYLKQNMSGSNAKLGEASNTLQQGWEALSAHDKSVYNRVGREGVILVPGALECVLCKKVFPSTKRRKEHMKFSCQGEECNICQKRFSSRKSLEEHKNSHHSTKFQCPECLKCFGGLSKLKRHEPVHDDTKKLVCEECGKTFTRKDNLNKHVKNHSQ